MEMNARGTELKYIRVRKTKTRRRQKCNYADGEDRYKMEKIDIRQNFQRLKKINKTGSTRKAAKNCHNRF